MPKKAAELRVKLSGLARLDDSALRPAEALLLLAALEHPNSTIAPYLAFLDGLAVEIRDKAKDAHGVEQLAAALFGVIVHQHHFHGEDGEDDNADSLNLMQVIDRRCGIAGLLSAVVIDAARSAGLRADLMAFPAHFLLRLEDDDGRRVILDPFLSGAVVEPPDMRGLLKAVAGNAAELEPAHYATMSNRDVVVRLQNEAKLRLLRGGHMERALAVVEATLLMAPDTAMLWREAGLMHLRLNNPSGAVAALEQFITRTTNAIARARTQTLLAELKSRLN